MPASEETLAFKNSLIILSTFTAIVNFLTFSMFIKFRKKLLKSNTHNRILCSMSLADALVGCFGLTLGILLLTDSPGKYYKLAGNIPLFSSMFASVGSLTLLTVDRLVALKRPHSYGTAYYDRLNLKLVLLTWVIPLLINIQQTVIYLETVWRKELKVRGMIFAVFFGIGASALVALNILLYFSVRKFYNEKEKMLFEVEASVVKHSLNSEADDESDESSYKNRSPAIRKAFAGSFAGPLAIDQDSHESRVVHSAVKQSFNSEVDSAVSIAIDQDSPESRPEHLSDRKCNRAVRKNHDLRQITFLCIVVVATFVVLWTPLAVYRLYHAAGSSLQSKWRRRLGLCFTITNSLLNPGIYFMFRKRFRVCFFQMLTCRYHHRK